MEFVYPPSFLEQVDAILKDNIQDENFNVEILSSCLLMSQSQVYRKIKSNISKNKLTFPMSNELIINKLKNHLSGSASLSNVETFFLDTRVDNEN